MKVGTTEVTRGLYESVMGTVPRGSACEGDCPVEDLTWDEAALFANALSEMACLPACYTCTVVGSSTLCHQSGVPAACPGYRMPTTVEWEYLARSAGRVSGDFASGGDLVAGTGHCDGGASLTDGAFLADQAWLCGTAEGHAWPVAALDANESGLFDVVGNVCEMTTDVTVDEDYDAILPGTRSAGTVDPWVRMTGGEGLLRLPGHLGRREGCLAGDPRWPLWEFGGEGAPRP